MNYKQLLFSQFRIIPIKFDSTTPIDENNMIKAMTVNEEIIALGYALSPKDIINLSKSSDLDDFYNIVKNCIGDVKAKPMYPNFPNQVMETDEAVFHFHQMLHYFSTYGIEEFTGEKVLKGWLPEVEDTEKYKNDDTLLNAKVISLINDKDKYIIPYKKILSKAERMDNKEKAIILRCVKHLSLDELNSVTVTFKQNLLDIFNAIFTSKEIKSEKKIIYLHSICQHTGDVWKCTDYALTRADFHFKTSQKRIIVKLLESYPLIDFKSNLIISNKKGKRTVLMLQYIDFNTYSRKKEYSDIIADFRNGKLRSWESRAKYLVENKNSEALDFYAERPGIMLRNLTYLIRNGYSAEDIAEKLNPKADELKTQTIVSLISFFSRPKESWKNEKKFEESKKIRSILIPLLKIKLSAIDTDLRNKKVYIDMPDFDLDQSSIRITDKSDEGGYIRSGLAYKIPESANKIRFFVYWNDKKRVDIDLHGAALGINGKNINIGWNQNFKSGALVFSGDITHSDAAEYFDIDLVKAKNYLAIVSANIHIYSGYNTFKEIDECYVGAMAVKKTGENIKLYNPKNCFFTHYLTGNYNFINYGYVDVQNRCIVFDGKPNNESNYYTTAERNNSFSLKNYLDILFETQNSTITDDTKESDIILIMGKPSKDNELSLIEQNFFMDY